MKKLIVLLVCVTLLLTACAAQSPASENVSSSAMDTGGYSEQAMSAPEASAEKAETGEGSTDAFADTPVNANRKMTYSASFSINTKAYDSDYDQIKAELTAVGGYIENEDSTAIPSDGSRIYGRSSYFTLRVPVDQLDGFLERLSEIGEVTNKQQSATDITDQYTDTDSRIAVLEERKNRLMTHLQNATETEDVIAIENQLADTIYELEQLQGSKRHMDNVVDYATVSVSLTELITPETIGSDGQPLGDRASDAFAMSMSGVGEFMENFAIFWAAAAPVLIVIAIFAVIIFLIIKLVRFLMKKYRAKHPKPVRPPVYQQQPYMQQPMRPMAPPQQAPIPPQQQAPVPGPEEPKTDNNGDKK